MVREGPRGGDQHRTNAGAVQICGPPQESSGGIYVKCVEYVRFLRYDAGMLFLESIGVLQFFSSLEDVMQAAAREPLLLVLLGAAIISGALYKFMRSQ